MPPYHKKQSVTMGEKDKIDLVMEVNINNLCLINERYYKGAMTASMTSADADRLIERI